MSLLTWDRGTLTRRPPPPAPLLPTILRSRPIRWLFSGTWLARLVYYATALSLFVGFFAVALWLGSSAVSLMVAGFVWLGVFLGLRRSPARHSLRFALQPRVRAAYNRAGGGHWLTAGLLWASALTPADVRALRSLGLSESDLYAVGAVLADHPERSERLACDLFAAASAEYLPATVSVLAETLDLDAAPEVILAYWLDAVPPGAAVRLLRSGVPLALYRSLRDVPDIRFMPRFAEWVADLWPPLAIVGCPPETLVQWATERPEFVTGAAAGDRLARWWASGAAEDAPWWADAGFTPEDAGLAIAAGNRRDRATLTGFAALLAGQSAPVQNGGLHQCATCGLIVGAGPCGCSTR